MIEWEHPEFGLLRVFFDSADVPIAVEFDLFTPDSERCQIMVELRERREALRIDGCVSVSALDGATGATPDPENWRDCKELLNEGI